MLEQADASGRLDSEDFTDADIVEIFGEKGMEMLVVDAITANTDRLLVILAFYEMPIQVSI